MMQLIRSFMWFLARGVRSLRYRVRVHGAEQLRDVRGPALILPNHPGYIDPPLLMSSLWPLLRPRPVLFEGFFFNPILYSFLKILDAVRIPGMGQASQQAREQTERAIGEVIAGLRRGERFVMWPAGRAERDGAEHLGANRAAAEILRAVPEAEVIRVRSRGIWGSSFTYAYTGEAPRLGRVMLENLGLLLANLLFFTPRRNVDITVERVDRGKMPEPKREVLNPWLEAFYNEGGPEKPTFVPYHFAFGPRSHEYPKPAGGLADVDLSQVKPQTREAVNEILSQQLKRPLTEDEKKPETTLDQLGMDSLERMELSLAVEQRFGFSTDEVPANVGQLWALAQGLVERKPPKPPPPLWFQPPSDGGPHAGLGDTIPAAFVARALANPKDVAVADDLAGVLTYERLLVGTLVMAKHFAELPGENVGLLLPASVACDVSFLGLHLAGKLPVILNWTTGPAHLAHAAKLMKLSHVVTSKTFIDRTGVEVGGVQYVFLEDLRKSVGKLELLRLLLTVRFFPGQIRNRVPHVDPHEPCVVLFTSGSERAPKAVPLTHANILIEMKAAVDAAQLKRTAVMIGFLPAFHSFGIAAGILLPVLGGMKVVHHPDPTDSAGLARKIGAYKATMLVGTPTFVSYIVDRAKPGELTSLRMIVVGAEKCPLSLYDRCKQAAPEGELLEGYGVTECSPVVAVNRPGAARPGTVGPPLACVEVVAVDVDTEEELPRGKMGVLWVSGPTIFPGYIGEEAANPFRERHGKRWYVTGDLAEISAADGYITLAGRLKRFLKAGGEMISLPALEEPFAKKYPPGDEGPRVAVEGIESDHGRRIVLFTTEPITAAEANTILQQEGFRGVMRLDEVRRVDKIPVLGTGKVDYKVLRAEIGEASRVA